MSVYKISEINENNVKDKIKFGKPCLNINHYFINCESDIFIQLDNVYFKQNFQKIDGKITATININDSFEKNFLIFDNFIINVVNDMFPLWFNKEMEMSDLLEYYIPTITEYYDNNENTEMNEQEVTSDLFSYTSSEDEENEDEENEDEENEDNGNIEPDHNSELSINCEIPYNYEESDLDIMIFDSSNNLIEELWNNIELMGKDGICIVKLSGLKIEKTKFHSVWELVQLKIC
jgi:hypothetical protein